MNSRVLRVLSALATRLSMLLNSDLMLLVLTALSMTCSAFERWWPVRESLLSRWLRLCLVVSRVLAGCTMSRQALFGVSMWL